VTYDPFRPSDLDALWEAENQFWEALRPPDARRITDHGWTIAEIPAHLARYHETVAVGVRSACGAAAPGVATLAVLARWDRADAASRERSMRRFRDSQVALREAATDLTARLEIPWLAVRGCRTVLFALEYLFYHDWAHFAEVHMLVQGWLPGIPERITHNALHFHMRLLACALGAWPTPPAPAQWSVHIGGLAGGYWRFSRAEPLWQVERVAAAEGEGALVTDFAYPSVETFVRNQWLTLRGIGGFRPRSPDTIRVWGEPPLDAEWPALLPED
jgi:hypothetical protein